MTLTFTTIRLALLVTLSIPALAGGQSGSTIATDRIFNALGVREGMAICEIGAGDGELSIAAARLVGAGGRVYTSELGDDRVKALRDKVTASNLSQLTVVAGDPVKTNFPAAACDALFMRNVYHHFADPAQITASIAEAVKPGGRAVVVDFTPRGGKEAERPADRAKDATHGVTPATVSRELQHAGFEPVTSELGTERWFMVVVAKPKG